MTDELQPYLTPTWFVDSDAPAIVSVARDAAGTSGDDVERACRLFYAVRDGIRYDAYNIVVTRESLRATHVLASGSSWCVPKSVLLAALCRASGIACRLCYANVCNHMATRKLLEFLGTNVFYYHGYNEIFLRGRWVKATVSFNRTLCEKAGLAPLDFDGVHDSIYHPFDLEGNRYMEYLHDYGAFADVPYDDLVRTFAEVYPTLRSGERTLSGDFEAELAAEAGASAPKAAS
ncbi:MAG: transglutaminase domain-containing protein [Planctomycetota bacterium]|nr:MAG: transglutaminase domain-containing protein [Planctomycetota bacterium]